MDNRVISSDDPNAIQKLQDKLEMCEKSQKYMKEVNAYYRKNGTCEGFPGMEAARAARLDFLRPASGESPVKLQPKAPKKDAPER